jgi:hypothetical protein
MGLLNMHGMFEDVWGRNTEETEAAARMKRQYLLSKNSR